jgi:hypothetical protein
MIGRLSPRAAMIIARLSTVRMVISLGNLPLGNGITSASNWHKMDVYTFLVPPIVSMCQNAG